MRPHALGVSVLLASACVSERPAADPAAGSRGTPREGVGTRGAAGDERDTVAMDSPSVFDGTMEITEVPPPPDMPATLREVRTSQSARSERVVFDFGDGRLPGYRIAYIAPPAQECGSGADAPLDGAAVLSVHFRPAQAHEEVGASVKATVEERDRSSRYPMLRQLRLVCDFEGSVEWALGLSSKRRYRILRLEKPARLVVDIEAAAR